MFRLRIAIYSRKSVYTGKGDSIENQVQMSKQYIFSRLENVTEKDIRIYEDEGYSAKSTDRPEFQRMLKDLREDQLDCIVCYRLDRISRNVGDFAQLIEEINKRGVTFLCIKEEFDTSKPMGKAMMYIASVFAQLERETIAERVRDNMYMLARTGRWLGGSPPTGYQSVRRSEQLEDGRERFYYALEENPQELLLIQSLYQNLLQLKSLSSTYHLYMANYKGRQDSLLTLQGVKRILSNPVYCIADRFVRDYFIEQGSEICFAQNETSSFYGLMVYNKRGFSFKREWIVSVGKHRGIVTGKDWIKAQELLEHGKREKRRRERNDFALLSNLLCCAKCHDSLYAKRRSGEKECFDYICSNKLRNGKTGCNCRNLNGPRSDRKLLDLLLETDNLKQSFICACDALLLEIRQGSCLSICDDGDELDDCKNQLKKLTQSILCLKHESDLYDSIQRDIVKIEEKIGVIDQGEHLLRQQEYCDEFNLKEIVQSFSVERQRELVHLMIDSVIWNEKELFVVLK